MELSAQITRTRVLCLMCLESSINRETQICNRKWFFRWEKSLEQSSIHLGFSDENILQGNDWVGEWFQKSFKIVFAFAWEYICKNICKGILRGKPAAWKTSRKYHFILLKSRIFGMKWPELSSCPCYLLEVWHLASNLTFPKYIRKFGIMETPPSFFFK